MTERKSDGGPKRGDGAVGGVSDEPTPGTMAWLERYPPDAQKWARVWGIITDPIPAAKRVALPPWARQPMIDSAAVKHRIVRARHDEDGVLWALGSDGRILWRATRSEWREIPTYPPGLEP